MWLAASREAGQPQCTYPQIDTLREFYQAVYDAVYTALI